MYIYEHIIQILFKILFDYKKVIKYISSNTFQDRALLFVDLLFLVWFVEYI